MSFQSAAVAVSVAQEIGFMVWDAIMDQLEAKEAVKEQQRMEIIQLADSLAADYDLGDDWEHAARVMQGSVMKAAGILGINIIFHGDAYDCPAIWSWEVA